jgi:hypothetical protein
MSEYQILVLMLVCDLAMGIVVPVEFILHEVRYQRELRKHALNNPEAPPPKRPTLRWPLVVVLCAALVSTFAFVIFIYRPASTIAATAGPEFLKYIVFGVDDGRGPTTLSGESTITTDKLRIFVDYSPYRGGWLPKNRVPISDIKDPVSGQRTEIVFTSSGRYMNAGTNDLWWGAVGGRYPIPAPDATDLVPAMPVRARLAIIGPSGTEQHYYFMLIRIDPAPGGRRFGILRGPETDWIAEWEGEAHK